MEDFELFSLRKSGLLQTLSSEVPIDEVIADWIDKYKENKLLGVLDLVQLLFHAAGHNRLLTVDIMEKFDAKEIIDDFSATIPNTRNPPILNKKMSVKLAIFTQTLILKCHNLLFDDFLLDRFFRFLIRVSRNSLRVFRLVGTLVGLKVITSLVNLHQYYIKQSLALEEQLCVEKAKIMNSQSLPRIELLQNEISEHSRKEQELTQILNDFLLDLIFKQRINDKISEIQILCLNEAVIWMQIYPQTFMTGKYLKYYDLFMSSSSANVRQAVLKSLFYLLEIQSPNHKLEYFIRQHIVNIVERTLDVSIPASVEALALLTEIVKAYGSEILNEQKKSIFSLVFSKHKTVAIEAGVFLLTWLQVQTNEKPSNIQMLKYITEFFEQMRLPKHAPYLVDSLIPKCPALEDWEAMFFVLMKETKNMSTNQETCFVKIMTAAVEQACSGKSPRAQTVSPLLSAKLLKMRNEQELKITEYFAQQLAQLLLENRENVDKILLLLHIAKHLKLKRMPFPEQILSTIVKSLEKVIEVHSNRIIIKGCCDVVEYFISQQNREERPGYLKRWSIETTIYQKFKQATETIKKCTQANKLPNEGQIFNLASTLEKIVIIYENKDMQWEDLWGICLNFISHAQENLQFPVAFIINCIKICHLIILWGRLRIEKELKLDDSGIYLQSKLLQLLFLLEQFLSLDVLEFRKSAFFTICDMLLIFCENGARNFPNLGVVADNSLRSLLRKYVEENVFLRNYEMDDVNVEFGKSVLTAYCKLVSYGMLKIEAGIWIFWYYEKTEKEYAAILKKTIADMLKSDHTGTAEALLNMLLCTFKFHLENKSRDPESINAIITKKASDFSHLLAASPRAMLHFHRTGLLSAYRKGSNEYKIIREAWRDFINELTPENAFVLHDMLEKGTLNMSTSPETYQVPLFRKSKSVLLKRKHSL